MSRFWKLGDNVATDEILPSQYMVLTEPSELALHILENVKPGFARRLTKGDVLLAGFNFGCGSSREHAPLALKGAGIEAIAAKSYARLFFRNCINLGIPAVVCPGAVDGIEDGGAAEFDAAQGFIRAKGKTYAFEALPPFIMRYVLEGGLINTVNNASQKNTRA
jgi:3-isopropylmalate/(R)-2-methylmalate dehydratase small subunit